MIPFKDLEVFREALALMVAVYRATEGFPRHELYGVTSQVRRSAGSVLANIAECQGRITYGEKRQFLSQARGSLYETAAHLLVARELSYLAPDTFLEFEPRIEKTGKLLNGMIRFVRARETSKHQPPNTKHASQP